MDKPATAEHFATLLNSAAPAVLTTYRTDGTAVSSPVWMRCHDNAIEVVIAEGDIKLRQLQTHPECSLLIFETMPPFRGLRIQCAPTLHTEHTAQARRAIASRYLGSDAGEVFAASRRRGVVLRFPLHQAKTWDLGPILPSAL